MGATRSARSVLAYAARCEPGEPRGVLDELDELDDARPPHRACLDELQPVPCLEPGSTSATHDEAGPLQLDARNSARPVQFPEFSN